MKTEVKWYRVIDPLSPLYGCDVRGWRKPVGNNEMTIQDFMVIEAMRRVDIFVGDRPFQLVAPDGEMLGLLIDWTQLEPSPLQDEIVELATDMPYGEFLEEVELNREDGCVLHLSAYERLYQVALLVPGPPDPGPLGNKPPRRLLASRTIDCTPEVIQAIRGVFERGDSVFDIKRMIEDSGHASQPYRTVT